MFVGKARSLSLNRASEKCLTGVGSSLTRKHYARLERLARGKCSSLFGLVVSSEEKKFYNIDTSGLYYKTFRIVIYDCNDSTIVEPVL